MIEIWHPGTVGYKHGEDKSRSGLGFISQVSAFLLLPFSLFSFDTPERTLETEDKERGQYYREVIQGRKRKPSVTLPAKQKT